MMSKTHLATGLAVGLAMNLASQNELTVNTFMCATIGGLLGGILPDIDTLKDDYQNDALNGQLTAYIVTAVLLIVDYAYHLGIVDGIIKDGIMSLVFGIIFIGLWIFGFKSEHRTFTHSCLGLVLFTISIGMFNPYIGAVFFFGYLSHLVLDVMNKKEIPFLYPRKKGICLKWFYASKRANSIFFFVNLGLSCVFLVLFVIQLAGM